MTTEWLLDLDEDALVAVLLGLPAPRRREWLFVALACKALHAAVLRAAVIDSAEEQAANGLPSGRHGAPVTVVRPTGRRFATHVSGLMATPLRIVYTREVLRPSLGLFNAHVPTRAREQFLRVLDHHLMLRQQPPIERAARARARTESLAAYRLTTRALYHMVKLAPLHTLRAAFFEVLGGNPHCGLDLSLRHHRCLVFFAAAHGRVDVLDWLVHRDPTRALAYDYDAGLLVLLWHAEELCMPDPTLPDHRSDVQLMLVRPAVLHNQVAVLEWLSATQQAIRRRVTGARSRSANQRSPLLSTLDVGGIVLSIRAAGVAADGTRIYGPDATGTDRLQVMLGRGAHNWRAFRQLVCEAGAGAATDVLDRLWRQTLSVTDDAPLHAQDVCMRAAVAWGMLLTLLLKPRRGAVLRWIVQRCHTDGDRLRDVCATGTHTFNPSIFDMEDLLHATLGTDSQIVQHVMNAFDLLGEERLLRERVVGPGDADKTEWLLDELAHTETLLAPAPDAPLPAGLHTYAEGRGWLARSMVGYMNANNEPVVGGGFFLRTELAPDRWSRTDSLCRHLLRLSHHMAGINTSSAPLLFETTDTMSTTLSTRIGPLVDTAELPESFVFESPTSSCNAWVPEDGLLGFTRLQQGLAVALRRWLLHVLDRAEAVAPNVVRDRFEDWVRPLVEMPEASYGALVSACEQLLGADDDDWTRARREVLSNLVTYAITHFSDPQFSKTPGAFIAGFLPMRACSAPRMRCQRTWAVAYAELARAWQLVPDPSDIFKCTQKTPALHEAMRRALMEDTHATGTLH